MDFIFRNTPANCCELGLVIHSHSVIWEQVIDTAHDQVFELLGSLKGELFNRRHAAAQSNQTMCVIVNLGF